MLLEENPADPEPDSLDLSVTAVDLIREADMKTVRPPAQAGQRTWS